MDSRLKRFAFLLGIVAVIALIFVACSPPQSSTTPPAAAPQAPAAQPQAPAAKAPEQPKASGNVNDVGKALPADAAPSEQQVYVLPSGNPATAKFTDISGSVYNRGLLADLFAVPLTRLNKDFQTIPGSAKSWQVSSDGKTWTFLLREDLNWSDGTPLTADDFVATMQYMINPKTAYDFVWYYEEGAIKNLSEANKGTVPLTDIAVRKGANPKELVIETTKPVPYLPSLLLYFMPLQKAALEKNGPTYNSNPATAVSSGPFIITEWTPTRVVAVANKTAPDDIKPLLNKVIALPFENQLQAYQANQVDSAVVGSAADIDVVLKDPVLSKEASPDVGDFRTDYLFFDITKAPYNNLKFRQALSHLVDRDSIVKSIAKPVTAKPAVAFLAPGFPASNAEGLKDVQKYDPELAKKLYAESGVKVDKLTLEVRTDGGSFIPVIQAIAQVFADEVKKQLGITVEVKSTEQKVFMDNLNAKPTKLDFGFISYGMDYLDPSNMLSVFRTNGRHNWNNAKFQALIDQAGPMTDIAARTKIYQDAERMLVEDVGAIFVIHRTNVNMWRPYLKGGNFEPGKVNTARGIAWPGFAAFSPVVSELYVTKDVTAIRPNPPK